VELGLLLPSSRSPSTKAVSRPRMAESRYLYHLVQNLRLSRGSGITFASYRSLGGAALKDGNTGKVILERLS
jgi:hypothetical protein